jgi:hypothetical protein
MSCLIPARRPGPRSDDSSPSLLKLSEHRRQAKASDKRAEDTYNDAAAVLHGPMEIQKHVIAQD